MNDPYPENLVDLEEAPAPSVAPTQDALIRAVNRLAQAVEQLALATLDRPQPVQNGPRPALQPLPPVQTVATTPPCPKHGVDKVKSSTKAGIAFYCSAKDPQGPRGWCGWSLAA